MAYTTADARQRLLDGLAEVIDEIAFALASLGEAYEQLDEQKAELLEQELFRPVQMAYGRAKRTHAEFAHRAGAPVRASRPWGAVAGHQGLPLTRGGGRRQGRPRDGDAPGFNAPDRSRRWGAAGWSSGCAPAI